MTDLSDLIADHSDKLKSILARRGSDWGFFGMITEAQIRAFAGMIVNLAANAPEVWQASYRGSDRLFYMMDDWVVVAQLDDTFESAWWATVAQIAHYRTGVKIK